MPSLDSNLFIPRSTNGDPNRLPQTKEIVVSILAFNRFGFYRKIEINSTSFSKHHPCMSFLTDGRKSGGLCVPLCESSDASSVLETSCNHSPAARYHHHPLPRHLRYPTRLDHPLDHPLACFRPLRFYLPVSASRHRNPHPE